MIHLETGISGIFTCGYGNYRALCLGAQCSSLIMQVHVRFFASLRERIGYAEQEISLCAGATVADAWSQAAGGNVLSDNILAARNMEYVAFSSELADGDEIAFFPPVTGGAG